MSFLDVVDVVLTANDDEPRPTTQSQLHFETAALKHGNAVRCSHPRHPAHCDTTRFQHTTTAGRRHGSGVRPCAAARGYFFSVFFTSTGFFEGSSTSTGSSVRQKLKSLNRSSVALACPEPRDSKQGDGRMRTHTPSFPLQVHALYDKQRLPPQTATPRTKATSNADADGVRCDDRREHRVDQVRHVCVRRNQRLVDVTHLTLQAPHIQTVNACSRHVSHREETVKRRVTAPTPAET